MALHGTIPGCLRSSALSSRQGNPPAWGSPKPCFPALRRGARSSRRSSTCCAKAAFPRLPSSAASTITICDGRLGQRRRRSATVENPSPELGQLSSRARGDRVRRRQGAAGVLVLPVDMPLIRPDTVRAALDAFAATEEPVLRATYRGRHGHPVIFGADVFRRCGPPTRRWAPVRSFIRIRPASGISRSTIQACCATSIGPPSTAACSSRMGPEAARFRGLQNRPGLSAVAEAFADRCSLGEVVRPARSSSRPAPVQR